VTKGGPEQQRKRRAACEPTEQPNPAIERFFAGVDRLRAHLDRHIQDPQRHRARLSAVAQDLLKSCVASDLGRWLCHKLQEAIGARACTLLLADTGWKAWRVAGTSQGLPAPDRLVTAGQRQAPVSEEGNLLVPVLGTVGAVGALWIEGGAELDAATEVLLQALANTAGVMLEQTLRIESLLRDPRTGLMSARAFVEQAAAVLRSRRPAGRRPALLGLKVSVTNDARQYGLAQPDGAAVAHLARAAETSLPGERLLGSRCDTVLALLPELRGETADHQLASHVLAVLATLHARTADPGPALLAHAAYLIIEDTVIDVLSPLEQVERELMRLAAIDTSCIDVTRQNPPFVGF
jgi:hypothetical protein